MYLMTQVFSHQCVLFTLNELRNVMLDEHNTPMVKAVLVITRSLMPQITN